MRQRTNQSGFSIVEILIVVVVVALIGFIGYRFYTSQADTMTGTSTSQSATADDVPEAPDVTSTSDLDKASTMIDETDTSSSNDTAELDSELEAF